MFIYQARRAFLAFPLDHLICFSKTDASQFFGQGNQWGSDRVGQKSGKTGSNEKQENVNVEEGVDEIGQSGAIAHFPGRECLHLKDGDSLVI